MSVMINLRFQIMDGVQSMSTYFVHPLNLNLFLTLL